MPVLGGDSNMYSRSLFVLDFAKWFFASYAQIYEAYVERTLIKFVYSWRKNSRKSGCKGDSSGCKGDSESIAIRNGGYKYDIRGTGIRIDGLGSH